MRILREGDRSRSAYTFRDLQSHPQLRIGFPFLCGSKRNQISEGSVPSGRLRARSIAIIANSCYLGNFPTLVN